MRKDRLKKADIKFFILPFIFLVITFASLTYLATKERIEERYDILEKDAIKISNSYSHGLSNTREAYDLMTVLLDEKLLVASKAIMLIENRADNQVLKELAQQFNVDEIYLYNNQGEVTHSTQEQFIGWKAPENHPVNEFMVSKNNTLVEEIRPDTETGIYYKFGYVKNGDGTFVQIGVLAENVRAYLSKFEIAQFIHDISEQNNLQYAFFIDTNYKIIAGTLPQYVGHYIDDTRFQQHMSNEELTVIKTSIDHTDVFQVSVPIYVSDEKLGTLSIAWPSYDVDYQVHKIILISLSLFLLSILITAGIFYYAYHKDKSNVQIAYYDLLTHLPNHIYLSEYLQELLEQSTKKSRAVMLLNCTNFKTLNMTYGFLHGDYILKQIAEAVGKVLDDHHMFFRFNADRFVLVIDDYLDREELSQLAQKLISIFNNPFQGISEHQYIDAEIAIVEINGNEFTVDKILQDASLTLSGQQKVHSRPIKFFNENMEKSVQRENAIEKVIRAVIDGSDTESFSLVFQPKIDILTNKVAGFEALARLYVEDIGPISPIEFIEIAERKLLIADLGIVILQKACSFIQDLHNQNFNDINIAVNISIIQLLRDDFIDNVQQMIQANNIPMGTLEFEITETVLLKNFDLINRKLEILASMGILIALDDFGTGFSSFARLSELRINTVKIDKCFIDKITSHEETQLITADIISMSHKLGLNVVAEGVETKEQNDYLKRHACDIIQGYLISKPRSQEESIAFLMHYQ
jgi:diguanylate cyclase (GGDEF)-like protein